MASVRTSDGCSLLEFSIRSCSGCYKPPRASGGLAAIFLIPIPRKSSRSRCVIAITRELLRSPETQSHPLTKICTFFALQVLCNRAKKGGCGIKA